MADLVQPAALPRPRRSIRVVVISIMLVPIGAFYLLLLSQLYDIPYWDDYDAVLGFLTHLSGLSTAPAKLSYFAAAQHNEYKLLFENALFVLQFRTFSRVNFAVLAICGDMFVLLMFCLLWSSFLPGEQDKARKLFLFLPVPFLIFQLNYVETVNWSMAGLQNLPVIAFSLACLASLTKTGKWSFASGSCSLVLAITASGNGFILVPVGLLMLLHKRRFVHAAIWVALGILIAVLYFHDYGFVPSEPAGRPSAPESHFLLKPVFFLSFLGAGIGVDHSIIRYASVPLGLILCAVFLLMIKRRYWETNPILAYFVLFVILTAIAVSQTRSSLGYSASLSSRYKIYSDLLLICAYEFICQAYPAGESRFRRIFFRGALGASVLFWLGCDVYGYKYLTERTSRLTRGVQLYEASGGTLGPVIPGKKDSVEVVAEANIRFRQIVRAAEAQELYRFPKL